MLTQSTIGFTRISNSFTVLSVIFFPFRPVLRAFPYFILPQYAGLSRVNRLLAPVLQAICTPHCVPLPLVSNTVGLSCGRCRVQHQFVIAMAFYPLLLMVYYPISSAYIIILSDAKHSWKDYCFHNAHPLRSTVPAVC